MTLLGPKPPKEFEDNGCGPKTALGLLKRFIPNGVSKWIVGRKLDWILACRYHDYHWKLAAEGKLTYGQADSWLFVNMNTLLGEQGAPVRAIIYPSIYWFWVRIGSLWKLAPWA